MICASFGTKVQLYDGWLSLCGAAGRAGGQVKFPELIIIHTRSSKKTNLSAELREISGDSEGGSGREMREFPDRPMTDAT